MHSYNGQISREDKVQLAQWIYDVSTRNISIETIDLESVPNWYKPIMAWHQLSSMGATSAGTLMPWHIPLEWVEKLAAAYICTTFASHRVHENLQQQAEQEDIEPEKPMKHRHQPIGKHDIRGGGSA